MVALLSQRAEEMDVVGLLGDEDRVGWIGQQTPLAEVEADGRSGGGRRNVD
jgi:hypothetical protein